MCRKYNDFLKRKLFFLHCLSFGRLRGGAGCVRKESLYIIFLLQKMRIHWDLTRQTKDEETKPKHLRVQASCVNSLPLLFVRAFLVICGELSVAPLELPFRYGSENAFVNTASWGEVIVTRWGKWLKQNQPLSSPPLCACLQDCLGWVFEHYITWHQLFRLVCEPTISAIACSA